MPARKKLIPFWLRSMEPLRSSFKHCSSMGSRILSLSGRSTNRYPAMFTIVSTI